MPYSLAAASVPVPTGPTASIDLDGSTSQSTTAPVEPGITSADRVFGYKFNRALAAIDSIGGFGGGVYGVCDGLTLSGSGLNCTVAVGVGLIEGPVQVSTAIVHAVPDSTARVYMWLKQDGTAAHTTTTTPPQNEAIFLGSFPTSGGNIGTIDYSGVVYRTGGMAIRNTGDSDKPADTPSANTAFLTRTSGATWLWDGLAYSQLVDPTKRLRHPVGVQTLSADLTLNLTSPNVQRLKCNGADRKVFLPSGEGFGDWFDIANVGDSGTGSENHNILVRDSGDTITIATLTPKQGTGTFVPTANTAGAARWPSSVTPAALPSAAPT